MIDMHDWLRRILGFPTPEELDVYIRKFADLGFTTEEYMSPNLTKDMIQSEQFSFLRNKHKLELLKTMREIQNRIHSVSKWLHDQVFNGIVDEDTTMNYSKIFWNLGGESIELIKDDINEDHVKFMELQHRQWFLSNADLVSTRKNHIIDE